MTGSLLAFPLVILVWIAAIVSGIWLLFKVLSGVGWLLTHVFQGVGAFLNHIWTFVRDEVSDVFRVIGSAITALVFAPLITLSVAVGRWSAAQHYGNAMEREMVGLARGLYRVILGNPARLLGLRHLTDGIEQRIPEAIARAPGRNAPGKATGTFDGYKVTGSLPGGGSGARIWLAEASPEKIEQLTRPGFVAPRQVVIKSFALGDGSTLPQIVRESRALEAARRLGLVLEHELTGSRFHYVMPYVPGVDLGVETRKLHDKSGDRGLTDKALGRTLELGTSLLAILHRFHGHGLWHKDVKPSNIIVGDEGVQLVDLGLLTPLRSAMTLTTHGTEYFRDPELVRLAMRGVKVNEVDGVKFDIYSAGAVLYSMLENSFPAHGSLSQITKKCPDALRFIVRRSMADIDHRYASAADMLADLTFVREARNPHKVKPAELPSVAGMPAGADWIADLERQLSGDLDAVSADLAAASPAGAAAGAGADDGGRRFLFKYEAGKGSKTFAKGSHEHRFGHGGKKYKARGFLSVMGVLTAVIVVSMVGLGALMVGPGPRPEDRFGSDRFADDTAHRMALTPSHSSLDDDVLRAQAPGLLTSGDPAGTPSGGPADHHPPTDHGAGPETTITGVAGTPIPTPTLGELLQQVPGAPVPDGAGLRVLVVNDLSVAGDSAVGRKVETILGLLRGAGFEVLDENAADGAADEDELVDLLASARSAVGLHEPHDDDAKVLLQAWLAAQAVTAGDGPDDGSDREVVVRAGDAAVDAVLWFGKGGGVVQYPYRVESLDEPTMVAIDRVVRHVNAQM